MQHTLYIIFAFIESLHTKNDTLILLSSVTFFFYKIFVFVECNLCEFDDLIILSLYMYSVQMIMTEPRKPLLFIYIKKIWNFLEKCEECFLFSLTDWPFLQLLNGIQSGKCSTTYIKWFYKTSETMYYHFLSKFKSS